MAGKQAKILAEEQQNLALSFVSTSTRYPVRNIAVLMLSTKAGLRAAEIAQLDWTMILDPTGAVADVLELQDRIAKKRHGRRIPIHPQLKAALTALALVTEPEGPVIKSERGGGPMTPVSICNFFAHVYASVGLEGCSSHSGRRTFITKAARQIHRAGGSLRDVQLLSGHRSIATTQTYIDGDSDAQRRLVALI
jgi:integrase/recombinase XerD